MSEKKQEMVGLTSVRAKELKEVYGRNQLETEKREPFIKKIAHIICEPMFLLLIVAAIIYFILGEPRDGAIMLIFVVGIIGIDVLQEWKTDRTLNTLKDLSAPHVMVIRDGVEQKIASFDLVPGDLMIIQEGVKIPADGIIMKGSDLRVDESSLTGETEEVWKISTEKVVQSEGYWRKDYCYAGTLVTQGSATILVDKIGSDTECGKIGKDVLSAPEEPTPLQRQTGKLVALCAGIAGILFILVGVFTYFNLSDHIFRERLIESILSGVTLAMAMIPEEFPVILTVFLSMGAWRLAKKKSLVRKLPSVETLGAISVLCVDKTGTITMNQMTVQTIWKMSSNEHVLIETMGLGCEIDAYDPMEKAMLSYCEEHGISKKQLFQGTLIKEYAFTNELKMMGHVWRRGNEIVIAAKGSPETILEVCKIDNRKKEKTKQKILQMTKQGLRVIAIAIMKPNLEEDIPPTITKCQFTLLGLVGLADPPRESVRNDIEICKRAGIRVVMITGDNGNTASSIAKKVGMKNYKKIVTGDRINDMNEQQLREKVKTTNIFARVIPEHKMRIVKALKENGEVVAMTGDGVNDAPALKYADIGIAMGKRGSEVCREAADLILMDDNFTTIVETIKDGRRMYDNIQKAIGYVFTIHIPIAFASLLAPFLGINPSALLLLPLHIVLLELIIDPTCSIVLERQPAETDIMDRSPRNPKEKLLNTKTLIKSIIQGLVIFFASFSTYYIMLEKKMENAPVARAMGLVIIIVCNLFLVQVNSSEYDLAYKSLMRLAKDKVMWLVCIGTFFMLMVILYTPLNHFLKLAPLTVGQFFISFVIAIVSVFWFEVIKFFNKK